MFCTKNVKRSAYNFNAHICILLDPRHSTEFSVLVWNRFPDANNVFQKETLTLTLLNIFFVFMFIEQLLISNKDILSKYKK